MLSDIADVMYKQSNYHADATEREIAYDDPEVGIEWSLPVEELKPPAWTRASRSLSEIAGDLPFVFARS